MKKIITIVSFIIFAVCGQVFAENKETGEEQVRSRNRKELRNELRNETGSSNTETKRIRHSYRKVKRLNQGNNN